MLLGPQVFLHLGIALVFLQLACRLKLVTRSLMRLVRLHRLAQGSLLAGELGHLGMIRGYLWPPHLRFDLAMAPRHPIQTVDQFRFSA